MSITENLGPRLFFMLGLLVLGVALLAAACGGGDGDESPSEDDAHVDDAGSVTFDVSMDDDGLLGNNRFEASEFSVSPGQQVTFNLTNNGDVPHNMRVDGGDGEYTTDDDTVSSPDVVLVGDAATLVWTASDEPGTVIFQCDFHPLDMIGTISVE